jgi:hypothetical protein
MIHPYQNRTPRNNKEVFGPFKTIKGDAYFSHIGNEILCQIGDLKFANDQIAFVSGDLYTAAYFHTAEDFSFFLKCSGYHRIPQANEIKTHAGNHYFDGYTQYIPFSPDIIRVDFTTKGIGIERDFPCAKGKGMSILKHQFSADTVAITISYWQEKDIAIARFIRFAIAIYVKSKYAVEFMAKGDSKSHGSMYTHFLFKMDYDKADAYFTEAMEFALACKTSLVSLLTKQAQEPPATGQKNNVFRFCKKQGPGHPYDTTAYEGASQFSDVSLIIAIREIISTYLKNQKDRKTTLTRGFFNTHTVHPAANLQDGIFRP